MKLPKAIEKEIQDIEEYLGSLRGQTAGPPRLRSLRAVIEEELRKAAWQPENK